jgi:hypothetical protein
MVCHVFILECLARPWTNFAVKGWEGKDPSSTPAACKHARAARPGLFRNADHCFSQLLSQSDEARRGSRWVWPKAVARRAAHGRLGQGESRVAGHRPKDRHVPLARRHPQGRLLSGTPRPATHAAPNFRGGPAKGRRRLTDATHWRIDRLFHSASGATPVTRHSSQPNVMSTLPHGRLEVASASLESLPSIASCENNLCSGRRFAKHGTWFLACRGAGRSRDCRWEPVDFSFSLQRGADPPAPESHPAYPASARLSALLVLAMAYVGSQCDLEDALEFYLPLSFPAFPIS